VIEDAAQAHGAERDGRRAGAFGSLGCFSFYPGKNLGACGEAGAVTTNDPALAARVRRLRDWGQEGKYNHVEHGFNARLDTLQAAVLGVKLARLDEWNRERRRVAALYEALLAPAGVRTPAPAGADHVWHVYAVQVPDRDAVRARLAEAGIATGIHYPRPVHRNPAYAHLDPGGGFPAAERLAARFLSLPIYPEMTDGQVAEVAAALIRILEEHHAAAA
jgi:dTDP-4-amino-4,6-dideoxygalactose transaminase